MFGPVSRRTGYVMRILRYITGCGTMANRGLTRAPIFTEGSLKSHLFLIFRNLNHLFSTRKWTLEYPYATVCTEKIEKRGRTAEHYGCLTIKSAIIAVIRTSLMALSEQRKQDAYPLGSGWSKNHWSSSNRDHLKNPTCFDTIKSNFV